MATILRRMLEEINVEMMEEINVEMMEEIYVEMMEEINVEMTPLYQIDGFHSIRTSARFNFKHSKWRRRRFSMYYVIVSVVSIMTRRI